jgi:hypothetical protein
VPTRGACSRSSAMVTLLQAQREIELFDGVNVTFVVVVLTESGTLKLVQAAHGGHACCRTNRLCGYAAPPRPTKASVYVPTVQRFTQERNEGLPNGLSHDCISVKPCNLALQAIQTMHVTVLLRQHRLATITFELREQQRAGLASVSPSAACWSQVVSCCSK